AMKKLSFQALSELGWFNVHTMPIKMQQQVLQPFTFSSLTKIVYGEDAAAGVVETIRDLGGKKTLIITDANLIKAGVLDAILDAVRNEGGQPVVFDNVPPDSDIDAVNAAAKMGRQANCDSVLAVGGGSVMDTAKVANICLTFGGDMLDYQGMNNLPSKLSPMI